MAVDPAELEQKIGYRFVDRGLLTTALTHASAVVERAGESNDCMELIGDAVIDLAVAYMLYSYHPEKDEGWLTQMRARFVNEESLAAKARAIGLGDFIILGRGEQKRAGQEKPSILAGAYEALIGAVFIDGGYEACRQLIAHHFESLQTVDDDSGPKNYKSLLQERMQKEGKGLPRYEVTEVVGPDHERVYCVSVFIDDTAWGNGCGKNKKEAQQEAARNALER